VKGCVLVLLQGIFKDKTQYATLTRMSYCQCRLRLVFSSIFKQFNWRHIGLIVDRSDLFSLTVGKLLSVNRATHS
jgi:atrial natriuretic peptide receptor A